jgi:ribose transport system ATP-binding protein
VAKPEVVQDDTAAPRGAGDRDLVLRLDSVDKFYPGVHALKGVSLEVRRGEIHALVGENGAGKSTLVGVAAGSVVADSGSVEIGGQTSDSPSPEWSREAGLAIVYQEPALLPDLTVAENMAVGMPHAHRPKISEQVEWAEAILSRWKSVAHIDPTLPVRELRPDARFVVEISRALAEEPQVIILDEPTEHLLPSAVEELFRLIQAHVERGGSVVYISHRLSEVKRIADTVSVLRDGALVGTFEGASVSEQDVINLIVGHEVKRRQRRADRDSLGAGALLEVSGLTGAGFDDVNLVVRPGEILGFAGIEGQGQREVLRALAGLVRSQGTVSVKGSSVRTSSTAAAQTGGILYLPQDRHNEGVVPRVSLRENAALSSLRRLSRLTFMAGRREREEVAAQFGKLRVKAPSMEVDIASLSGGNQQKVVLSRVLLGGSAVILADEPSQGVDVGAREEIYEILRDAARSGIGVIVLSSSAPELEQLCDRVVVFSRGQIVAELEGEQLTEHGITHAALTASKARAATTEEAAVKPNTVLRRVARNDLTPSGVLVLAILALGVVAALQSPFYLTERNFTLFLPLLATLAFFSLAQQLVMMVGGIDLSVGPLASFLVVVGSFVLAAFRTPFGVALGLVILCLVAIGVGLVNWLLTTVVKINPLLATLVTFTALQGLAFLLRPLPGGTIDPNFITQVRGTWGPLPVMLVLAMVIAVVLEVLLYRSRRGITLRAVGSNPAVAERVGISSGWARLVAYVGCSLLVVPASVMLMAQAGTGNPSIGDSYTLASIAAAVLGGASIFGGRGSFIGAFLGAALIIQTNTVVQFLGLQLYWQQWFLAGLTIFAVAFYSKSRAVLERKSS